MPGISYGAAYQSAIRPGNENDSNRHRMQRKIDAMLTAFRAAKRVCAVMMIDLDRLEAVNDTFGHKAGDE